MKLRPVCRVLARLLLVLAVAELLPALCCLIYGESQAALAFVLTAGLTGLSGVALGLYGGDARDLYRREGVLIVVGGWLLASLFGALPYLLTGTLSNPVDALFESASGFTTTGASIMTTIEDHGRGILFWRSFSQWLGGMGIIVLFVALLPELGPGARFLYKLEVPGPTAETLHPRVHDTAAVLWKIYLVLTALQTAFLMAVGMDLYDALTHTFSTLSTGGFSPRGASVGAFDSPAVELVIIVFMVLAGVNFSLYYGLRARHGLLHLLRDSELRIYLGLLLGASVLMTFNLLSSPAYDSLPRALLDSIFQVVSIVTTSGFSTADFDLWPNFSRLLIVALMFVGACAGSTAGGMKIMRFVISFKAAVREVRLSFSPNSVIRVLVGGSPVPDTVVRSVVGFFFLFVTCWVVGTILLSVGNLELEVAASATIAALANIGPGLGQVGPTANFAFFADWQKLVLVLLMWIGRLELYSIAALFTAAYWRR